MEEGAEVVEGEEATVEGEGEETEVVEEEETESFLPGGPASRPHQNIFTQGAYNWDGSAIYQTFTPEQI